MPSPRKSTLPNPAVKTVESERKTLMKLLQKIYR